MKRFAEQNPGESLKQFAERVVKPTPDEMRSFREDVEKFAKFLRENLKHENYSVAEVLKSGSQRRGTATKDSDIDLVVFFNGITSLSKLNGVRPQLLKAIEEQASAYSAWGGRLTLVQTTEFSVKYKLEQHYGSKAVVHEVDILPAFDVLEKFENPPVGLYTKISGGVSMSDLTKKQRNKRYREGRLYSASLAPLQIDFMDDFFQNIPDCDREGVKDAICLLKYWKKEHYLNIRSYSIDLLAVHAYKTVGFRSMADFFDAVLKLFTQCGKIRVAFNTNYRADDYISFRGPPFILDPANPFMDTMIGVRVKKVREAARETLGM